MVPAMPFDVPKMQKAQAEAPCLMRIRQTDQQIPNSFILGLQVGTVTMRVSLIPKVRHASATLTPRRLTALSAISRR